MRLMFPLVIARLVVRCADCGQRVKGRRLSAKRGGNVHPYPHHNRVNGRCAGHQKAGTTA